MKGSLTNVKQNGSILVVRAGRRFATGYFEIADGAA
jgi:hypothetical protein